MADNTSEIRNITKQLILLGYNVEDWQVFGMCHQDFLETISPFWLQFRATDRWFHVVLFFCYLFIVLVGVMGNGCVVYQIFSNENLRRRPFNVLLLNLALSDLLMTAKSIIVVINSAFSGPVLGSTGCQMYSFSTAITGVVTIYTWTLIAWNREVAVCRPLHLAEKLTFRKAVLQVVFTWSAAFVLVTAPATGMFDIHFTPEAFLTSCSFDYTAYSVSNKVYIMVVLSCAFVAPCLQISRSYFRIHKVNIGKHMICVRRCEGDSFGQLSLSTLEIRHNPSMNHDTKLTRTLVCLMILWFIAWTPYATVALLGVFNYQRYISPVGAAIPGILCKISACVDPFVYTLCHRHLIRKSSTKQTMQMTNTGLITRDTVNI